MYLSIATPGNRSCSRPRLDGSREARQQTIAVSPDANRVASVRLLKTIENAILTFDESSACGHLVVCEKSHDEYGLPSS